MVRWQEWLKLAAVTGALATAVATDTDCQCCDDYEDVIEMYVLDHSDWYWYVETPDADKNCHAKFKLEISWNNLERKRDGTQPSPFSDSSDLRYEFRADEGSFNLFQIAPQKDSQPTEAGGWSYWWYWTDDVGAKNEESNPTHYKIVVSAPGLELLEQRPDKPSWWQIWVRASIEYVPWDQSGF